MGWGLGGSGRKAMNVLKFIALLQEAVIVDDNSLVRDEDNRIGRILWAADERGVGIQS